MSKVIVKINLEIPDGLDVGEVANAAAQAANDYLKSYIKQYTKSSWEVSNE